MLAVQVLHLMKSEAYGADEPTSKGKFIIIEASYITLAVLSCLNF